MAQPPLTINKQRFLYLCSKPGTVLFCSSSGSCE
ncbi:Uncharacterised protein [Vibrio cholerae]|nr:Uncharacterised protein [Vibrio cholerae]